MGRKCLSFDGCILLSCIYTHQIFTYMSVYLKTNAPYYTYTFLYMSLNHGDTGLVEFYLELFCNFFFTITAKTGTKN